MSSILDALKKLENEKEEQEQSGGDLNWPQPVNTKSALYNSLSRTMWYRPMVLGAVGLVAVSFGAWFFLTRDHQPDPVKTVVKETVSQPMTFQDKKPASVDHAPETTVPGSHENDGEIAGQATRTSEKLQQPLDYIPEVDPVDPIIKSKRFQSIRKRHRNTTPERGPQDVTSIPQSRPPAPPASTKVFEDSEIEALSEILPQNIPRERPDLKAMWDERINEHVQSVQASIPVDTKEAEPETAELDEEMSELLSRVPKEMLPPQQVVEGDWLKLHAISWSEDPARRIAVINAKLVKEGGRIEGALVSRIERDYVVIQKNGEEMMLPFGNK